MDPRDRADAALARAHARRADVVTPSTAISPMDSRKTLQIPRSVVDAADPRNAGHSGQDDTVALPPPNAGAITAHTPTRSVPAPGARQPVPQQPVRRPPAMSQPAAPQPAAPQPTVPLPSAGNPGPTTDPIPVQQQETQEFGPEEDGFLPTRHLPPSRSTMAQRLDGQPTTQMSRRLDGQG
jgi:hypothetical protein